MGRYLPEPALDEEAMLLKLMPCSPRAAVDAAERGCKAIRAVQENREQQNFGKTLGPLWIAFVTDL